MNRKSIKAFLDANVIIEAGKPPGGPIFKRLVDLVESGFVEIITTDLTKDEVVKKHAENDYDVIKEIGRDHFRDIVKGATGVELPQISKEEVRRLLFEKYFISVGYMFERVNAKLLLIDAIKPSEVFSSYTHKNGFFSGEGKKDQFSDAFIFECIKKETSKDLPIIIVSKDGDFYGPSKSEEYISVVKSIEEIFKELGLEIHEPEVETFLEENHDAVVEDFDSELRGWGLQVSDIEDAEIEDQNITHMELMDLVSFGTVGGGKEILVTGSAIIKANVSYTHPDWESAIYDSEDKVSVPFRDVSGETEVEIKAQISMLIGVGDDGRPDKIKEVGFRNDKFVWVELDPYDTYFD